MSLKDLFKKNKSDLKTMKLGTTVNPKKSEENTFEDNLDSEQTASWNDVPDSFENEAKEEDFDHLEKNEITGFQEPLNSSDDKKTESSLELASLSDDVDYENKLKELYAKEQVYEESSDLEPNMSLKSHKDDFAETEIQHTEEFNSMKSVELPDNSTNFDDEPQFDPGFNEESFSNTKEKKKFSFGSLLKKKNDETTEEDFGRRPTQSGLDEIVGKKKDSTTGGANSMSESSVELTQKSLPLIGKMPVKNQYQVILGILGIGVLSLIGAASYYQNENSKKSDSLQLTSSLLAEIQKFDNKFTGSTTGKKDYFSQTLSSWNTLRTGYDKLLNNDSNLGVDNVLAIHNNLKNNMAKINKNIDLLKNEEDLLNNTVNKVEKISVDVSEISDLLDKLILVYVQSGTNDSELINLFFLKNSIQSLNSNFATILLAEKITPENIASLAKSRKEFKNALADLYYGDTKKGIHPLNLDTSINNYNKLTTKWVKFANQIDEMLNRSNDLIKVKQLSIESSHILNEISDNLSNINNYYQSNTLPTIRMSIILIVISFILSLIASLLLLYLYSIEKDNRSLMEKLDNSKNQGSILKLLNEMMPLQDGDLTKKTTVTEEITGAIADSINATVDSLSSLVKKIKDTSLVMREKTNEVSVISLEMLRSNEQQADSLASTGASVIEISKAINEISNKTKEGAEKAYNSVDVATSGANQVYASIESMQHINQNMTETVHLMRKVGDSSKQISEIVNLLSDITEETNILALNATVQAAKAGEAGKGFKIVADSIQELADNAADATRRVGALIAAVQTDIQSVGVAIEKTTQEVQKGVGLSEEAGKSLQEMTQVSNELAEIVSVISKDASRHADIARQISSNMEKILKVTEENKESTKKTATSITEIAEISNELGESVQSFKVE